MRFAPLVVAIGVAATGAIAARGLIAEQSREPVASTTTASIAGVVVDDQDPARPVRRAVVTLTGSDLRPSRGAITDDEGRFTLGNLPAGRFRLVAERGGYVASIYGAKRPGRPGTDINVANGQQITNLGVRLWRGAVIAGVLRDESGQPLSNTTVTAIPIRAVTPATLTFNNNRQASTNDLGEYRIFGLEPGSYVVRAGETLFRSPAEVAESEAEIDATFAALVARMLQPGTTNRSVPRVSAAPTIVNAAPIYFPGTAAASDATPITVKAGEERGGVDFDVRRIRSATLRGIVLGRDGAPVSGAFVRLASSGALDIPGSARMPQTATSDANGTFVLSPVSPGTYVLLVRGALSRSPVPAGSPSSGALGWAQVLVPVAGPDIDFGTLTLQPGMTFSGRIAFDSTTTAPPDSGALRVEMQSESIALAPPPSGRGGSVPAARFLQPAAVLADGSFQVRDLVPDDYRLGVSGAAGFDSSAWWIRSITWNGRDGLDSTLRVAPGEDVSGVTVVLSDRRTELSGTITTPNGSAVSDLFVLAFPSDATLRVIHSRRIQAVRPDSSGRFAIKNLPPGDYLVCALTDVDDGEWNDAGFLDPLVPASARVTLGEGEKKVQDLRVRGN